MANEIERDCAKSCETIRDRLREATYIVYAFKRKCLEVVSVSYVLPYDTLRLHVRKGDVDYEASYSGEFGYYMVVSQRGNEAKSWNKDEFGEKYEWADIAEWIARKDDWE